MVRKLIGFTLLFTTLISQTSSAIGEVHNVQVAIQRLKALAADADTSEAFDLVSLLGNYPFTETQDALLWKAQAEANAISLRFSKLEHGRISHLESDLKPKLLFHVIANLSKEGSEESWKSMMSALSILRGVTESSHEFDVELTKQLDLGRERVLSNEARAKVANTPVLGSLKEAAAKITPGAGLLAMVVAPSSTRIIESARKDFLDFMATRFVGQRQLVEIAADLIIDSMIFPKQSAPHKLLLMGLKGSGASTFVRLYSDYLSGGGFGWGEKSVFPMPQAKDKSDLWKIFGSATGYYGSDNVPPLIRFLVSHSGGKYRLDIIQDPQTKRTDWAVLESTEVEGPSLASVMMKSPNQGIVYFENFQNWTQDLKDELQKIMDTGNWPINNPGRGLTEIHVPVQMIFTTSEGSGLIASRDTDGSRFGEPLSFEKMHEKWRDFNSNRELLLRELQRSNIIKSADGALLGYSPDFISHWKGAPVVLLEPQSTENLRAITHLRMADLSMQYSLSPQLHGSMIKWDEQLVNFVQQFRFVPEDMATGIEGNIKLLLRETVNSAIADGKFANMTEPVSIFVKPLPHDDGTWDLQFIIQSIHDNSEITRFSHLIRSTIQEKKRTPMPEAEVARLSGLIQHLNSRVFGLHPKLVKGLTDSILLAEENKYSNPRDKGGTAAKAAVFGFFGLSSTGKTQTAKEVNLFVNGSKTPITLDFSQIQTVEALKEKILGYRDSRNLPVASDFMKHYDRNNGEVLLVLDELANAPILVTKALYDILREPVVTTFSDGHPRPMQKVKLIITGNAGEEIYKGIPKSIPEWIQMYAMQDVYHQFINDPGAARAVVERYFSAAFLNRIGEQNIYHFGPLTFRSLRELAQFKLVELTKMLKPKEGLRGWDLRFESREEFLKVVSAVENHGFVLAEQGASVDRYIFEVLARQIRVQLLQHRIPSNELVVLKYLEGDDETVTEGGQTSTTVKFRMKTASGKQIDFQLLGRPVQDTSAVRDEDRFITAIHETGHLLVRKLLFGDSYKPVKVSIIPGVTMINNKWVLFNGVASAKEVRETRTTLESVIAEMAVLSAGDIAQRLVTKGRRHDSGKSNDMERMTTLAHRAILSWGLSEVWGTSTIPSDMSINQYIESLTDSRRQLLSAEVDRLILKARYIAEVALMANIDNAMIPIAHRLATEGILDEKKIEMLFSELKLNVAQNGRFHVSAESQRRWAQVKSTSGQTIDAQLMDAVKLPTKIARYEDIVAADRLRDQNSVELPKDLPLAPKISFSEMLRRQGHSPAVEVCDRLLGYSPNPGSAIGGASK